VNANTTAAANESVSQPIVTVDRRRNDRRSSEESARPRPILNKPAKKANRRRHIDPTTCERDYRQDEIDFMRAMDDYKRAAGRMFPTCSEVLEVIRSMGYVRLNEEQIELLGDTLVDTTEQYEADHDAEEDDEEDFE
jgi:hypothetical protein